MSISTHDSSTPHSPPSRPSPFTPADRDRQIFRLVKFHGQRQSQIARDFNISQATVSRIVHRFERWLAHGGPALDGEPTHEERLRSQLWLTYERNEHIIAAALRLAAEMELSLDSSKSTVSRPLASPSSEKELRTEHKVIDRSSIAARFLRLAHRVNMDQLALVHRLELTALESNPRTPPADTSPDSTASTSDPGMDLSSDNPSVIPMSEALPTPSCPQTGDSDSPCSPDTDDTSPRLPFSPWQSTVAHSDPEITDTSPALNNLNNDSPPDSPLTGVPETICQHSAAKFVGEATILTPELARGTAGNAVFGLG